MAKFFDIKIHSITPETTYAKVISFEIPAELKETFKYLPGQFITIEVEVDGKKERRAYSLCSSPVSDELPAIGVKMVEGGKVSPYLTKQAQVGEVVRLFPPRGNFIYKADFNNSNHLVMFAGGSGVTPIMSIIRTVLDVEPNSKITLFYANRDQHQMMFKPVLDGFTAFYDNLKVVYTLDVGHNGWDGRVGYLDTEHTTELLETYIGEEILTATYYSCGPGIMMDRITDALNEKGVLKENQHRELFTASIKVNESVKPDTAISDTPIKEAELHITLDGEEFDLKYDGEDSILEVALDNDIDAPFACQVGACCTCRAKLLEGKVHMEDRESLSDEEIEEGFILTCQSKPLTPKLVYTYDE